MTTGYQALDGGAALLDFTGRGLILVRGRDRARLLHNLTSNEVKKMTPGSGCYAFLLSPQGRIQADLNLFCFDDHFLIDTEPELGAKVLAHIRRYIIADQVELEEVSGRLAAIGLEGPGAAALLAAAGAAIPGKPYSHLTWNDAIVAAVSSTGQPGFRIFTPDAPGTARQLEAAGAAPASAADARAVRIENGVPRYGDDIFEATLPQETQQLHGVSFTKGCYLGQEIVERIRARGHVNRKLVRLEVDSATPPVPGAKVHAAGAEAGEITSSAFSPRAAKCIALAYLRVPYDEPGTELTVEGVAAVTAPPAS